MSPPSPATAGLHVALEKHLEPLLGDFTAKMAVRTAALRSLQRPPEEVGASDVPALVEGLRPMLNTFLGSARATQVVEELRSISTRS